MTVTLVTLVVTSGTTVVEILMEASILVAVAATMKVVYVVVV